MDDLISRQDAIISLVYADETSCMTCGDLANVVKVLQRIPSAQAELIHCRDCKWHNGAINQCSAQICASMRGDDFCSRAERRTDE